MKHLSSFSLAAAATVACLTFFPCVSRADTTTNIDISSQYGGGGVFPSGSWADGLGGPGMAAAPTNGNTGTGITFTDWSGSFSEIDAGSSRTFDLTGVALTNDAAVNTLMNTFYGDNSVDAIVTFTNSLLQTVQFSLVGDQTIRDYNNSFYANDLQGFNTAPGLGAVTTENWWNNGQGQRLDVQTFVLPTSWDGTTLTSMTISTPQGADADDILSAVQVVDRSTSTSPVPEPSSLVLLGTGLISAVGAIRRRNS